MEKIYSTKQNAIRGMWRAWERLYRDICGNPLISEDGTYLQGNANGRTYRLYVTYNPRYAKKIWILIN
jgi:hypothetical protein